MIAGSLAMACIGVAIPLNLYFFGDLMTKLVTFDMSNRASMFGNTSSNMSSGLSECGKQKIQR